MRSRSGQPKVPRPSSCTGWKPPCIPGCTLARQFRFVAVSVFSSHPRSRLELGCSPCHPAGCFGEGPPRLLLSLALFGQTWSSLFLERAFSPGSGTYFPLRLLRKARACLKLRVPGSKEYLNGSSLAPGLVMVGPLANEVFTYNVYS